MTETNTTSDCENEQELADVTLGDRTSTSTSECENERTGLVIANYLIVIGNE